MVDNGFGSANDVKVKAGKSICAIGANEKPDGLRFLHSAGAFLQT